MSRNGTLEDALKSISDFNHHHGAENVREQKQQRALLKSKRQTGLSGEKEGSGGDSSDDGHERRRRKRSKEEKNRKKRRRKKREESEELSSSSEEEEIVKRSHKKHKQKRGEVSDASTSDDERAARRERKRERRAKDREDRRKRKDRRRHARDKHVPSSESDSDHDDMIGPGEAGRLGDETSSAAAIEATEKVLDAYAELRSELVQLLSTLDGGQAVDISSIPDAKLQSLLTNLFRALRLQKSPLNLYLLPQSAPKTLQTLAPILAGVEHVPVGPAEGSSKESKPERESEAAATPPSDPNQKHPPGAEAGSLKRPPIGPALPSNGFADDQLAAGVGLSENGHEPPGLDAPDGESGLVLEEKSDRVEIGPAVGPPPAPKKRVIGPAAPPPEVLEAAAKLTEAEDELRSAHEEDDVLIGPPPPALVAEADNTPEKERFDAVNHILAPTTKDPYALLRVKADAPANEIKKRYWKISLLVHPDKCTHPQAQTAFTALNKAFKELEDPAKRAIVDARLAEIQRRAEFAEEMAARREAAQWRKLRGQSEPGDEALLGAAPEEDEGRDTWMTELPPERQAGPAVPMQSTYFSSKERRGRGDTSAWTDNPQEKAKKAQQQYLEAYSQAMLGPSVEESQAAEKASATAQIIDSYNNQKRAQTLVEKHQEALLKKKQDKKKKKKEEPKAKEDWEGSHPWKPWDREKDLAVGKTVKLDKDSSATALASRFGAGRPGERKFL